MKPQTLLQGIHDMRSGAHDMSEVIDEVRRPQRRDKVVSLEHERRGRQRASQLLQALDRLATATEIE